MKEETRRAIAHAVVVRCGGAPLAFVYSEDAKAHTAFSGTGAGGYDHAANAFITEAGGQLFHHGTSQPITITMLENRFNGYDHASRHHFIGSVDGNTVLIFDYGEGKHFRYQA